MNPSNIPQLDTMIKKSTIVLIGQATMPLALRIMNHPAYSAIKLVLIEDYHERGIDAVKVIAPTHDALMIGMSAVDNIYDRTTLLLENADPVAIVGKGAIRQHKARTLGHSIGTVLKSAYAAQSMKPVVIEKTYKSKPILPKKTIRCSNPTPHIPSGKFQKYKRH